jgi:hypothetical protein
MKKGWESMKKIKNYIWSLLTAVILTAVFCTSAMAVVSTYDQQYLSSSQQSQINVYTNMWEAANAAGNQAGMDAAHAAAEAIRATANYSGGQDGSQYIPFIGVPYYPWGYYPPAPTTYTIMAMAGTGGNISPGGSTTVTQGNGQSYNITANTGYKITDVKVDGSSIGAASTYTFNSVTSSHSISATFASAATLNAGDVTLGDGGSGTLKSGNVTKSGYGITVSLPVNASFVSGTTVTASYKFTTAEGAKTVTLDNVGGTWQFPVSASSASGARKIYIPIDTKDGTYTITFTVRALDPQATALTGNDVYLTSTKTAALIIKGSMYEDDFTGDS